jgi:hypothetical protein
LASSAASLLHLCHQAARPSLLSLTLMTVCPFLRSRSLLLNVCPALLVGTDCLTLKVFSGVIPRNLKYVVCSYTSAFCTRSGQYFSILLSLAFREGTLVQVVISIDRAKAAKGSWVPLISEFSVEPVSLRTLVDNLESLIARLK